MTDPNPNPNPNRPTPGVTEVLFEIINGTEYATLHADTFRTAMRERDALRAKVEELKLVTDWADMDALRTENERLRAVVEAARDVAEECSERAAPGQWDDYHISPTMKQAALIKAVAALSQSQ